MFFWRLEKKIKKKSHIFCIITAFSRTKFMALWEITKQEVLASMKSSVHWHVNIREKLPCTKGTMRAAGIIFLLLGLYSSTCHSYHILNISVNNSAQNPASSCCSALLQQRPLTCWESKTHLFSSKQQTAALFLSNWIAVQRSGGCPIPRDNQSQTGLGFEQSDLAADQHEKPPVTPLSQNPSWSIIQRSPEIAYYKQTTTTYLHDIILNKKEKIIERKGENSLKHFTLFVPSVNSEFCECWRQTTINIPGFLAGSVRASFPWGDRCWLKGGRAVRVNVTSVLSMFMSAFWGWIPTLPEFCPF